MVGKARLRKATVGTEDPMKFVLFVYHGSAPLPGTDGWNAMPEKEQQRIYSEYADLNRTPGLAGGMPLGLPAAAKTVRVRDGQVEISNGTYQPEAAGGYSVYEADSMEAAIAVAAKIPAARLGGAIEIRPAEKYW
jgi:hypothetical protein